MKILSIQPGLLCLAALLFFTSCSKNNTEQKTMKETTVTTFQDPHSYARPSEAVMTHLNWEAEIDFDKKEIKGIARITIQPSDQAKALILDTKNLNIEKVTTGKTEEAAPFKVGEKDEFMGSPLTIGVTPETSVVNVYYSTSEGAEALQWLEPVQTAGDKYPFLFTQSEAILARTWIPLQDSPGIRFTYEATVKVPPALLALMSAENPQQKNEEGIYKFTMEQPIPAYLMALAVGNLTFEPIGERTGVYAEPEVIEKAAYELDEMDEMLAVAEELYVALSLGTI